MANKVDYRLDKLPKPPNPNHFNNSPRKRVKKPTHDELITAQREHQRLFRDVYLPRAYAKIKAAKDDANAD